MRRDLGPIGLVLAAAVASSWVACGDGDDGCVAAVETCNGLDDDCDGATDEAGAEGCAGLLRDADADGFGVAGDQLCLCAPAAPYTATDGGDASTPTGTSGPARPRRVTGWTTTATA